MSLTIRLATALTVVALAAGAGGCAREPGASPETPENGSAESADSEGQLTGSTLPSDVGYAWDIATYTGTDPIPVQLSVAGPWTLTAGADWSVSTTKIVAPEDVPGIDQFQEFDFVEMAVEAGGTRYYPRQVTDEWLLQLGSITVTDAGPTVEPYAEPMKVWPLGFEVGDSSVVLDGENFRIEATVLAKNQATVPAGVIEDAYLVRFEFIPVTAGAISGTQYYILAPDVGFVAAFGASAGDEATGFTALESVRVLMTMPEKR